MISLSGFDDWLNSRVEEQAAAANQTVEVYIAQAVAARLITDVSLRGDDVREELMQRLAQAEVPMPESMHTLGAVVGDPARLAALHATGLLDSPPDQVYDRITMMAADALAAPSSAFTLVDRDRQFFKSLAGVTGPMLELRQTGIERSICQYAVASGQPLIVTDARVDPILKSNPAVVDGDLVSYLGIPLIDGSGYAIGTLCVWDHRPRQWTTGHIQTLRDLAQLAANRIWG
jgi:GAF domain-containing protein